MTCSECDGTGEKLRPKDRHATTFFLESFVETYFICRCRKCKGEKTVEEKTRQEIFIEKGMIDGQRIVLAGGGDQEVRVKRVLPTNIPLKLVYSQPGIPAGDVIFVLKASPHASFERSGDDLLTKVAITLSEALLGFSRILITHLDGRGIKVVSPPMKAINPGSCIVVRDEGMPIYKRPDQKGDLYVRFEVEMPDEQWLKSIDIKVPASAH